MRCLIVFTVLFLAAQFAEGVLERLDGKVGDAVTFNGDKVSNITFECYAIHNDNRYRISPNKNLTDSQYNYGTNYCSFTLYNLKLDNAGVWVVLTKWVLDDIIYEKRDEFELFIETEIKPVFDPNFHTDVGTYVTIYSQKQSDYIDNCTLVHYIKNSEPVVYDLLETLTTISNIKRYGNCGVRLLVDESIYGDWYIIQSLEPYHNGKFYFNIAPPAEYEFQKEEYLVWELGSTEKLKLSYALPPTYCEVIRPDGKTITIKNNSCIYQIPKVDDSHAGLWRIRNSASSKMRLKEKRFNVQVYDPNFINTTIVIDLELHLMCKMYHKNLDYCIFTRHDGVVFNAREGLGDDMYNYYGNGYKALSTNINRDAECGLTIHKPSDDDFGTWKCTLGFNGKFSSALVQVVYDEKYNKNYFHELDPIFVKRGDNFTIKCQTSKPLDYCWLRSPDNKIYTVSNNPQLKSDLLYDGEGLALGVCGAKISNASDEHAGNWSCRLGVNDSGEEQSSVLVTITESYLYPTKNIIDITDKDRIIQLSCNVLPEKDTTIKYCRWVHPDGYGIYKKGSIQYITWETEKSCLLQINQHDAMNFGNWTCYARLLDDLDHEVFTTIQIIRADQITSTVLTTTVICLIIIIPVSFCIIGLLLYKKKLCKRNRVENTDYNAYENDIKISQEKMQKI